jgi:hypothetical protein
MNLIRTTPLNGRNRTFYFPNENQTDEDIIAYVEPIAVDKLGVFRCVNCEVRIGNEFDIVRKPSVERKLFIATFNQT